MENEQEPVIDNLQEEGQTQTTQTATMSNATTSWYSDSFKDVVAKKGWKTGDDALKSYTELERSMGSRVKIPAPEAPEEEKRAFYQKIGCPESADGYTLPDIGEVARDENVENAMKQIAFDSGTSNESFASLVKGYYDMQAQTIESWKSESEQQFKPEEIKIAARFCENCSDEFKQLLENTGMGNNPVFIKEFLELGKKTMSGGMIKGDNTGDSQPTYEPKYKDSPQMYATGETDEDKKARAYFSSRGYKY